MWVRNALIGGSWLTLAIAGFLLPVDPNIYQVALLAIAALCWRVVNAGAISARHEPWLHAAPYVTALSGYLLLCRLIDGATNGPWVYGYVPTPGWVVTMQLSGLVLVPAWPVATVRACLLGAVTSTRPVSRP